MVSKKRLSRLIALSLFVLSCNYTPVTRKINSADYFDALSIGLKQSKDGRLFFQQTSDFARMAGIFESETTDGPREGVLDIYENHPEHGKVMTVRASYGAIDFCACDGWGDYKLDGNPDYLLWKFKKETNWRSFEVPNPEELKWPLNNVHENATDLEFELLATLKDEFGYEIMGGK